MADNGGPSNPAGPFRRSAGDTPGPAAQPTPAPQARPFPVGYSLQNNAAAWVLFGGASLAFVSIYVVHKSFFLDFVHPGQGNEAAHVGFELMAGGFVTGVLTLIASTGPDGASFALVMLAALWLALIYSTSDSWGPWLAKLNGAQNAPTQSKKKGS